MFYKSKGSCLINEQNTELNTEIEYPSTSSNYESLRLPSEYETEKTQLIQLLKKCPSSKTLSFILNHGLSQHNDLQVGMMNNWAELPDELQKPEDTKN